MRFPPTLTASILAAAVTISRKGVVDQPVARQNVGEPGPEVERPSVEVLDATAGLVDQQRTGADVPGVRRVRLEEGVDATRRDVGEAQRRRAETAHGAAAVGEGDDALPELADRRRVVGLHAGAHQRLLERLQSPTPAVVDRRARRLRRATP